MRNDKILAYKMRMRGQSYTEISEGLGMSKSTLSGWFKHLDISKEAKEKIANKSRAASINALLKINKVKIHNAEATSSLNRSRAQKDIHKLTPHDLLLLGVTLYWAEGYKSPIMKLGKPRTYHPVSFTSSDPQKIKMFLRFLREYCKVSSEKITADLRMNKNQSEVYLLEFWRKTTSLGFSNFKKVYKSTSTFPYGTLQIRVNDTVLFHKIMGWIEGLQNS